MIDSQRSVKNSKIQNIQSKWSVVLWNNEFFIINTILGKISISISEPLFRPPVLSFFSFFLFRSLSHLYRTHLFISCAYLNVLQALCVECTIIFVRKHNLFSDQIPNVYHNFRSHEDIPCRLESGGILFSTKTHSCVWTWMWMSTVCSVSSVSSGHTTHLLSVHKQFVTFFFKYVVDVDTFFLSLLLMVCHKEMLAYTTKRRTMAFYTIGWTFRRIDWSKIAYNIFMSNTFNILKFVLLQSDTHVCKCALWEIYFFDKYSVFHEFEEKFVVNST